MLTNYKERCNGMISFSLSNTGGGSNYKPTKQKGLGTQKLHISNIVKTKKDYSMGSVYVYRFYLDDEEKTLEEILKKFDITKATWWQRVKNVTSMRCNSIDVKVIRVLKAEQSKVSLYNVYGLHSKYMGVSCSEGSQIVGCTQNHFATLSRNKTTSKNGWRVEAIKKEK